MLLPFPRGGHDAARIALKQLHFAAGIKFFAPAPDQFGFVIKGVHLAGSPRHEELHDAFGPGGVVQAAVEPGTLMGRQSSG